MHITKLHSNRVSVTLEPLTIITGPNFSGKTTVLNLIRAGIIGHIPELGKTNGKTFEIADGPALSVDLTLSIDKGTDSVYRSWESKRGSITKTDHHVPAWLKPPITLNAREYFDLTPAEKVKFIFKHVQLPESLNVDGIIQRLNNLEVDSESKAMLTEAVESFVSGSLKSADPEQIADRIAAMLDEKKGEIAEEYRYHKKRAKDTEGTIRVLTELKNRAATFSSESLDDLNKRRDEVKVALDALKEAVSTKKSEESSANAQREILIGHRQRGEARLKDLESAEYYESKIEALTARLHKAQADLEKAQDATIDKQIKALHSQRDTLNGTIRSHKMILDKCRANYGEVSLSIKELEQTECCPHCKSSQDGWRSHLLASLQEQLAAHKKEGEASKLVAEHAVKEIAVADKEIEALTQKKEAIAEIQRVADKIQIDLDALIKDRNLLIESQKFLDGLQIPDQVDHSKFITATQEEIAKLEAEQQEVQTKIEAEQKLRHELARAQEAETEHLEANQKAKVFELIGKELRTVQKELIDTMFNGLLADINWFTEGLLDHKIEYHDGELGYFKKGGFITHRTFSGTESAILYAAASVALSSESDFKIIALDEFDIDQDRMTALVDRLNKAIEEGRLEQAIIAHTGMEKFKGAHVVNMGAQ